MKLTEQSAAYFCRSLALLLHSGVTLAEGVHLLAAEEQKKTAAVLEAMGLQLDRGEPLSRAMEDSGAFEGYASGLVRVGEETGRLEQALETLADQYETRHRIRQQLRRAVAWPAMLLALMLAVAAVLLVKVLPVFDSVYASLGSGLTGPAALLLTLGERLEKGLPLLLAVVVLAALVAPRLLRKDWGIAARFHNARYVEGLAMGLACGLPEEQALELARQLLKDTPEAGRRCELCQERLQAGAPLPEALKAGAFLDAPACRLLAVGQRGGNGDRVLGQIARRMMEEAFEALETAAARVEPLMVLTASALVGGILLTVMLPLLDILSAMG